MGDGRKIEKEIKKEEKKSNDPGKTKSTAVEFTWKSFYGEKNV
jgi:hypothetical protein